MHSSILSSSPREGDKLAIIRKVVNLTFSPRKKSESFIVNIFTFSEL